jgi:Ca-activated chloride channel homolog
MTTATRIQFSPLRSAISAEGGICDLIVRVQAHDTSATAKTTTHTPKRLALVVDRSGSMSGQPLDEALRCVMHIAQRLTPEDRLAVFTYDDEVNVVQPLAPVDLSALQTAIKTVTSGGMTDLFAGWQAGAKALYDGPQHAISRVLLLSDGCANKGLTTTPEITPHVTLYAEQGIGTTTIGLGSNFNEELMIAIARHGRGQQYYGQQATDLYDKFDEELQLLQALCLRHLGLELIAGTGVVVQYLGVTTTLPNGQLQLPDLAPEAEAWVAVRLHLTPQAIADSPRTLLAATLHATALDGQAVTVHATPLQLPIVAPEQWRTWPVDTPVANRLDEAEFAKDSQQLAQWLRDGQRPQAHTLLNQMQKRYNHHAWLAAKLQRLAELATTDEQVLRKEAHFSSERLSHGLVATMDWMEMEQEKGFSGDETESAKPAFLRKKIEEGRGRRQK